MKKLGSCHNNGSVATLMGKNQKKYLLQIIVDFLFVLILIVYSWPGFTMNT